MVWLILCKAFSMLANLERIVSASRLLIWVVVIICTSVKLNDVAKLRRAKAPKLFWCFPVLFGSVFRFYIPDILFVNKIKRFLISFVSSWFQTQSLRK